MTLDAIAISPSMTAAAQGLLVGLHGWGANAQALAAYAPDLSFPNYQLLFPNAPFPHRHTDQGRVWYDLPELYSFQSKAAFGQHPEVVASRDRLTEWLQTLPAQTGIPLSRTLLAGFSQGGAMALDVGLNLPLAAIMVLGGYLHAPVEISQSPRPKILMVHGRHDQVVPLTVAHQVRDELLQLQIDLDYYEINTGHAICPPIFDIMQSFIVKQALTYDEVSGKSLG